MKDCGIIESQVVPSETKTSLLKDLAQSVIAPMLVPKHLNTSIRVSKQFYGLFMPPLSQKIKEFMQFTVQADWYNMSKVTAQYPLFMFKRLDFMDIDNQKKSFSPVEYVFYVHDRYGQDIYERCARKHGLLEGFFNHAKNVRSNFDIEIFFNTSDELKSLIKGHSKPANRIERRATLDKFLPHAIGQQKIALLKEYKQIHDNELIDNATLNAFWQREVGYVQRYHLPRHMLRQMFAKAKNVRFYRWDLDGKFNDSRYPDGIFLACTDVSEPAIDIFIANDSKCELGKTYALVRKDRNVFLLSSEIMPYIDEINNDADIFKNLWDKRILQQERRLEKISKELNTINCRIV